MQNERFRPPIGVDSDTGLIPLRVSLKKKLEFGEMAYIGEIFKGGQMTTILISEDDEMSSH